MVPVMRAPHVWVWHVVCFKVGVSGEAVRAEAEAAVLRGRSHHADFVRGGVPTKCSAE